MNQQMMKKIQRMQREIEEIQDRISKTEFKDQYQGVTISMLGTKEVTRVEIDNDLIDLSMKDMLEELLQVAFNNTIKKIDDELEKAMAPYQSLTGAFGF